MRSSMFYSREAALYYLHISDMYLWTCALECALNFGLTFVDQFHSLVCSTYRPDIIFCLRYCLYVLRIDLLCFILPWIRIAPVERDLDRIANILPALDIYSVLGSAWCQASFSFHQLINFSHYKNGIISISYYMISNYTSSYIDSNIMQMCFLLTNW